jgi:hypothetical protein
MAENHPSDGQQKERARRLATDGLSIFAILLLCYGYFLPKTGDRDWVANSRAALVYAVVDQGVLHIDAYHESTGDKAFYNGHYYTIASIGPSLVALPAYVAFKAAVCAAPLAVARQQCAQAAAGNHSAWYSHWALVWITFAAVSIPSAALGALVFVLISQVVGSRRHAFWVALLYGLATVAFPYSRAFFQHQVAAFGLAFGFYLLWRVVCAGAQERELWGAGLLFGLSAISEYPLVFAVAALVGWAAHVMGQRRLALNRLVLGAAPLLLAMAAYNLATFGTPLPVAYRYHVLHAELHSQGFMGVTKPSLAALYGITFSPARGLFFTSPVLLLMFPGFVWLWQTRRLPRPLVVAIGAAVASFFLYTMSYIFWSGGSAVGPRYLVPMLPLAMLPAALAIERAWVSRPGQILVGALAAASLFNVWALTIAGQYYPPSQFTTPAGQNPLVFHALPLLAAGDIAENYGHYLGLAGWWSVLPLALALAGVLALRAWLMRPPAPTPSGARFSPQHSGEA